jgi:hypothetical protein
MPTNTYVALDTKTLGTAAASVTFSSIPQGYTDLELVIFGKSVSGIQNINLRFNGDTGTRYSSTLIYGNGTNALSVRNSNVTNINTGFMTTTGSLNTVKLMNYSNTTTSKTILARGGDPVDSVNASVGLWRAVSNAAITSIDIIGTGNFDVGSTFTIYGIKAQVAPGTAKATGGTISYDAYGYVYHTFTGNGTFTPNQTLSCDYLVVAGGGGGGWRSGNAGGAGGGGGGGFRSTLTSTGGGGSLEPAITLSATSYSIQVGAGGPAGINSNDNGTQGTSSIFSSIISAGGGYGGINNNIDGGPGGSGGGSSQNGALGGAASPAGQGYAGGGSNAGVNGGGGGGGAGAIGVTATGVNGGNGGNGLFTAISNAVSVGQLSGGNYYLSGGGGGGTYTGGSGGTGGLGGGTNGTLNTSASNAASNTGGGGGSVGSSTVGTRTGGAGGSGIVIIRYSGV